MPPKSKTQKPRATQEKRVKASAVKKTASEQHSSAEKAETKPSVPSKKRKLEVSTTPTSSPAGTENVKIHYVYSVIGQEFGPYQATETKYYGAYTSIKDANNKIIDLWSEVPDREVFDGSYGEAWDKLEADSCIRWEAEGEEGDGYRAWIEKLKLVGETKAEAKGWGEHRPGHEKAWSGDESE